MAFVCVFFLKLETAYELGIGDWISDVCSSDRPPADGHHTAADGATQIAVARLLFGVERQPRERRLIFDPGEPLLLTVVVAHHADIVAGAHPRRPPALGIQAQRGLTRIVQGPRAAEPVGGPAADAGTDAAV